MSLQHWDHLLHLAATPGLLATQQHLLWISLSLTHFSHLTPPSHRKESSFCPAEWGLGVYSDHPLLTVGLKPWFLSSTFSAWTATHFSQMHSSPTPSKFKKWKKKKPATHFRGFERWAGCPQLNSTHHTRGDPNTSAPRAGRPQPRGPGTLQAGSSPPGALHRPPAEPRPRPGRGLLRRGREGGSRAETGLWQRRPRHSPGGAPGAAEKAASKSPAGPSRDSPAAALGRAPVTSGRTTTGAARPPAVTWPAAAPPSPAGLPRPRGALWEWR